MMIVLIVFTCNSCLIYQYTGDASVNTKFRWKFYPFRCLSCPWIDLPSAIFLVKNLTSVKLFWS